MATTTITTTAAQDSRLVVAFGSRLQTRDANNVRRNATAAEIKADLIRYMTQVVLEEESAAAAKAAANAVTEITPT
jgi:hypothetical protein